MTELLCQRRLEEFLDAFDRRTVLNVARKPLSLTCVQGRMNVILDGGPKLSPLNGSGPYTRDNSASPLRRS